MRPPSSSDSIFSLPATAGKAGQVVYGLMLAGVFFAPSVMLVYQRFIAPITNISTKEFFVLFSATYILLFIVFSASGTHADVALRKRMGNALPQDVMIVAPAAANSDVPEIIELGRKYWFWQLVNSYFSGVAFSWVVCIFVLFVI